MTAFHKILFPVDFSERCRQCLPYVAGIARAFESEVTLLHALDVHDPFGYGAASSTVVYGAATDVLRSRRDAALEDFGHSSLDDLPVRRVLEVGEPADCITAYALRHTVDLIVMPTHGRGRFRRTLLGSVTAKVLHDTECPVWTMAHSEMLTAPNAGKEIRSILCAVDHSAEPIRLLQIAGAMAKEYGAVVQLVHAMTGPASDVEYTRIAAWQEAAGTHFEVCVTSGDMPANLRAAALVGKTDLIIVDRDCLHKFFGHFRTRMYEIIREAPCPVLSV